MLAAHEIDDAFRLFDEKPMFGNDPSRRIVKQHGAYKHVSGIEQDNTVSYFPVLALRDALRRDKHFLQTVVNAIGQILLMTVGQVFSNSALLAGHHLNRVPFGFVHWLHKLLHS